MSLDRPVGNQRREVKAGRGGVINQRVEDTGLKSDLRDGFGKISEINSKSENGGLEKSLRWHEINLPVRKSAERGLDNDRFRTVAMASGELEPQQLIGGNFFHLELSSNDRFRIDRSYQAQIPR